MDNFSYQRLKDTISKADNVAIAVGKDPSVDDMAGALGLFLALKQMGKSVSVASASQPLVEHSNLVGIDKVKSQFGGGNGDLVVSFPYKEGEIEKVSYTIDQGYLNIVVKAGQKGLNFQEQDVRFSRGGGAPGLVFIVGTPRLSDLGSIFNPDALKNTTIVNIDNKRDNQGFGDIVLVSQQASSVSEEVVNMLLAMDVDFDVDTAQNFLIGITQATNGLQDPQTSPVAFEMVGRMMQKGAQRVRMAPQQQQQQYPARPQPQPRPQMPRQPNQGMQQQRQQQNEERVSSFRPEQSLAGTGKQNAQQQQPTDYSQANDRTREQSQDQSRRQPPSDWLTPKVYKGSSNVQ